MLISSPARRTHRALIVCKVATGNTQQLRSWHGQQGKTKPDQGYDSICGLGGDVYHETVVYREDAIIPVGVVIFP